MADHNTAPHQEPHVPKVPSGRRGSLAKSRLPHGVVHHPDIGELLRNSAMHFGGSDATVAHLLKVDHGNLTSGDPHMHSKPGIALPGHLNHLTQHDASRIAHGLVGARRHASPESRDLYTAAIHHMGYRFDEHGHIHKVHKADFSAAMQNPAFRAHIAVERYRATHEAGGRYEATSVGKDKSNASDALGASKAISGLDARGRGAGGVVGSVRISAPSV